MTTLRILIRFGRFYLGTLACYLLLAAGGWLAGGLGGVLIAAAVILSAELAVGPLKNHEHPWPAVPWRALRRLAAWTRHERAELERERLRAERHGYEAPTR